MAILFIGGIKAGLWESLGLSPLIGNSDFTLKNYSDLLSSQDYWQSWGFSMKIALISTSLSTICSLFILYIIFILESTNSKMGKVIYRLSQFPMVLPYIVAGGLMYLLFLKSGWISRLLFCSGINNSISDFPTIIGNKGGIAIIMAYLWKTSPFIVLMTYPAILELNIETVESAQICGASRWSIFWEILFPSMLSSLKNASFIVFSYSFGAFEIPFMLGVTWPKSLSVYSWQIYNGGSIAERPMALAINITIVLTIATVGLILYVLPFFMRKVLKR